MKKWTLLAPHWPISSRSISWADVMHKRIAVDLVKSVHLVAENVRADVVRQHRRAGPSTAAIASPHVDPAGSARLRRHPRSSALGCDPITPSCAAVTWP